VRFRFFYIILFILVYGQHFAQDKSTNSFKDKNIGIYTTKRNLYFSAHYNKLIASFIQQNDSLNLTSENLKYAFSIYLGNYLADKIQQDLGTQSCFFMNSLPKLAPVIIQEQKSGNRNYLAIKELLPKNTHYLLFIDEISLTIASRKGVFAFSNEMFSEKRKVKIAKIKLLLYKVENLAQPIEIEIFYDEDKPEKIKQWLRNTQVEVAGNQFFTNIFNIAVEKIFVLLK